MPPDFDDPMRLSSEARLWKLIDARAEDGADVAAIDARIWEMFGEEWAIVFTDLAGFSRKTAEFGIIHFLQVIHTSKKLLYPIIDASDGLVIKSEGDSLLLLFRTAERALECAIEMQRTVQRASARMMAEDKVLLCIGVGVGRVLRIGDDEVWGREVNNASKLGEDAAKENEILISGATYEAVRDTAGLSFEKLDADIVGSSDNYRVIYPAIGAA